jgi:hypothetical protein
MIGASDRTSPANVNQKTILNAALLDLSGFPTGVSSHKKSE